ncbi:MAG: hypothetical protein QNK84_04500 [Flavobacteriales bacterium]|jgi:hypothetical protein|tara:strand:+ start:705 stop:959 length:255 start_codon:yes stop_codon:yes gene_type:complete
MAKRITNYSKLSKDKKEYINSLLDASELKIIEVNFKKGVIVELEEDEFFVVLDTWTGFDKREENDDDEEDGIEEEMEANSQLDN